MAFKLLAFVSVIISSVQMTVIEDSFLIPPNKYRNKQNILIACLD